jgi:peptidoglycan/LPS O-acetylase OafA/YrhL
MSASMTSPEAQTTHKPRLAYIDTYRGVAICAVVGIHACASVLGSLRKGSLLWTVIASVNTLLLFAVPAFLFISAFILIRNSLEKFDQPRYIRNRLQQALVPYLLWSLLYAFLASRTQADFQWKEAAWRILIGKSYLHLYFMGLILQFYLVFPLLLPFLRRKPPFGQICLLCITITLGFYALNRWGYRFPYVGSILFWYTPAVILGLWLGTLQERLSEIVRRGSGAGAVAMLLGYLFYRALNLDNMLGRDVNTFLFQCAEWLYTTSAAFCLLCFLIKKEEISSTRVLSFLGVRSMQIYLLHPMLLSLLNKAHWWDRMRLVIALPLCMVILIGVPLLIAQATAKLRISPWIFGR